MSANRETAVFTFYMRGEIYSKLKMSYKEQQINVWLIKEQNHDNWSYDPKPVLQIFWLDEGDNPEDGYHYAASPRDEPEDVDPKVIAIVDEMMKHWRDTASPEELLENKRSIKYWTCWLESTRDYLSGKRVIKKKRGHPHYW